MKNGQLFALLRDMTVEGEVVAVGPIFGTDQELKELFELGSVLLPVISKLGYETYRSS